ncbi:MAG TPA: Smr/MutS family protein [Rectinemataceae bacterium]
MISSIEHEHSFALLDFERIRAAAADYCMSAEGRGTFLRSLPTADVTLLAARESDLKAVLRKMETEDLPAPPFPDIESGFKKLRVEGAVLEIEDFYAIGTWARSFDTILKALRSIDFPSANPDPAHGLASAPTSERLASIPEDADTEAPPWESMSASALIAAAPKLNDVYKIVFSILEHDGQLKELPEIRRLRQAIAKANKELLNLASSYGADPELRPALQSTEPALRDGRTVLAVRANFKGRVKGIVHEVSSTGQTIFIEPTALVEKNNEIVQLSARLAAETARILKETSQALRAHSAELAASRRVLAFLDPLLARARQCRREETVLAETCSSGLVLWRARHPLLGKKAVPIDVALPDETRTLIVTGPNTGGKTVTLKTIGLFSLMHQLCLGLPAAPGTKLPVFDAVLADIGDEQSIDQSLSTFSGHMGVIADIVRRAGRRSLVLLDELGAGTDPEEGCAIAMGLLDHFIEAGSLTIATTHHGILKNYGYTKPGCLNACMEFDSTKLSPTYRIVMGVPGESRALEIAGQTGLDPRIVDRARRYLDEERSDVGELIRSLSEKHRELEKMERERARRLKEAAEDQRKADLASLRIKQRELELRKKGVSSLEKLLSESRKTLENLVKELRESGSRADATAARGFIVSLEEATRNQEAEIARIEGEIEEESDDKARRPRDEDRYQGTFEEGAPVLYGTGSASARLVRKIGKNRWIVEVGSLRLQAKESELRLAPSAPGPRMDVDIELASAGEGRPRASFELDLRGMRLVQALEAVEKQIDAASLSGLSLFSLIHGTGEGVLGPGIHSYLKSNPAVAEFHFARPEEGGYGKTIVRLKA